MLKKIPFYLILSAVSVFAMDDTPQQNSEKNILCKQETIKEDLPTVSIYEILQHKQHTPAFVSKESIQHLLSEQLHLSNKQLSSPNSIGTKRLTATLNEQHLVYVSTSNYEINVEEFKSFMFDPGAIDGAMDSLLIPITGIKEDSKNITFRIKVENTSSKILPLTPVFVEIELKKEEPQESMIQVDPVKFFETTSKQKRGMSLVVNKIKTMVIGDKEKSPPDSPKSPSSNQSPSSINYKRSNSMAHVKGTTVHPQELIEELKRKQEQKNTK